MNKNCFEIIFQKISESKELSEIKSIEKFKFEVKTENNLYQISYDSTKKIIIIEEIFENSKNILSSWSFEEENVSPKDIKMITDDFINIMTIKPKNNSKESKKSSKNEENNMTCLFFVNRMVNIFPELKEKIRIEKEKSKEFKAIKFTKENILPLINDLIDSKEAQKNNIKKLATLLSDLYKNGSLDVRSLITMGILNNIENHQTYLNNLISDELKKSWECSLKYKNKKIKPEKESFKKSLMSKALEYQKTENLKK